MRDRNPSHRSRLWATAHSTQSPFAMKLTALPVQRRTWILAPSHVLVITRPINASPCHSVNGNTVPKKATAIHPLPGGDCTRSPTTLPFTCSNCIKDSSRFAVRLSRLSFTWRSTVRMSVHPLAGMTNNVKRHHRDARDQSRSRIESFIFFWSLSFQCKTKNLMMRIAHRAWSNKFRLPSM